MNQLRGRIGLLIIKVFCYTQNVSIDYSKKSKFSEKGENIQTCIYRFVVLEEYQISDFFV